MNYTEAQSNIAYTSLSGKLGLRTCDPERLPLRSQSCNDPFLKTDLEHVFANCLIFDKIFYLVYLKVVKNTYAFKVTW